MSHLTSTEDQGEERLWKASHDYLIGGEKERKTLENIEESQTKLLRRALIALARNINIKGTAKRDLWTDEDEKELWITSWLYMNGKVDAKYLEYVEAPYTQQFKRSLIARAKHNILRRLFFIGRR
jgi:hypothetical protein